MGGDSANGVTNGGDNNTRKRVITVSLARSLTGKDINDILDENWSKTDKETRARFDNVGFNFDIKDVSGTLQTLQKTLREEQWDGVIIGWCIRGYAERTELFEQTLDAVLKAKDDKTKLMFCSGPTNLMDATLRHFPS